MENKIVKYGTCYNVRVEQSYFNMLIVICDEINEGFVLMGHGIKILPKINDNGKIVFTKGPDNKGYWKYQTNK